VPTLRHHVLVRPKTVKKAKLWFIVDLAPLATDTYTVRYDARPNRIAQPETDLKMDRDKGYVELTTSNFGVQLLLGEKTYAKPAQAIDVPAPVMRMRLGDGTWFGGSRMFGETKVRSYSAKLTDGGPVFARCRIRYTYADGNTLALTVQVAAGDNAMRMETRVGKHQPNDGFDLFLSKGLPPLIFHVQDERRRDRPCFAKTKPGFSELKWADISMVGYVAPKRYPPDLVTRLTPWEDWFGTFTQARIRLKLASTKRELQIRSLDPGSWVEPRAIEDVSNPNMDPDPAKGLWAGWRRKCMPITRSGAGEMFLRVDAAKGARKWTVSDCLSMPGVAALFQWRGYESESEFPRETRPAVSYRLNKVKDYVLDWPGDAGKHPRLFMSRSELAARWKRKDADPAIAADLLRKGSVPSADRLFYTPNWSYDCALGAYLLSGGSQEVAKKTLLLERLRQALQYDLWGFQFGGMGAATSIYYDALIDSPVVSKSERSVLRARMAYFAYRVTDPAVWSAERGYCSGNQNMTVCWEISRGLVACTIPEHPMAMVWYGKAKRIMEYFLTHMVGPAGEWPESMSHHGRVSTNWSSAVSIRTRTKNRTRTCWPGSRIGSACCALLTR